MTVIDCFEADLPGELAEIIPFPGSWEPDPEVPAACALWRGRRRAHPGELGDHRPFYKDLIS